MRARDSIPSDEPEDGDFARYVESLVGGPPEDPEQAARELSKQIAGKPTAWDEPAADTEVSGGPQTSSGHSLAATVPGTARAHRPEFPRIGGFRRILSPVLFAVGAALIALNFLVPAFETTGAGMIAIVLGVILGRSRRAHRQPEQRR